MKYQVYFGTYKFSTGRFDTQVEAEDFVRTLSEDRWYKSSDRLRIEEEEDEDERTSDHH